MDLLQNSSWKTPKVVDDLIIYKEKFLGKHKYFLMSEQREKYLKLTSDQYEFYNHILKYLDGNHTLEEVDNLLVTSSRGIVNAQKLLDSLYKNNLLDEQYEESKTKVEMELSGKKLLDIPLDSFQEKHTKAINFIDIVIQLLGTILIIYAFILVCFNQDLILEVYRQTKLFSWKSIQPLDFIIIGILIVFSIPIHEIGHLLAANRYNIKWKRMVFALRWGVNPVYYIKYFNFYSNSSKRKIITLLSGVYFNFIQACIYFILLVYTYDWKMAVLAITNLGCIVSCLLPSGTSDGYHVMSILLDIEGIRWKMIRLISKIVKVPKEIFILLKQKENKVLITYFIISYGLALYGCYILLSTVVDYLHIFSADKTFVILIMAVLIMLNVMINIFKFVKNLKNM